ncbi:Transposase (plasmid) [Cupriavidus necator H16]|uniref:Uncharacterized protein n=1 Tax=Cupriavidus necator (strain ATCC 17699 / DSM 428 / KCTC 22496 / NCIMB 10442 / H16 / Stanier 337) TaxID=381666 RepID=Q7WX27_CUPNH|nr:hypothetical protein [Cupriavidus necator]AAP86064.1 hypothetical protein PHG315 [Cupriavidus necator H16]QCC05533.1 hypothetical protein E6A55_33795 [Cupriavidus necator H16]QQB81357.1 hypothetical protein I6H87_33740 [Cupriavidus necator]
MYNARIEAFRAEETLSGFQAMTPASADLKRFCRKQVAEMIQRAGVEFGIDGAPIAIDETRLAVDGYPNIWEAIRAGVVPDLDRFWNLLRDTYEADGPEKAEQQMAATLVRAFGLASSSAVRRSTVFVRLKLIAISETVSDASRPSRQLHFGSLEPVTQAFAALAVFARRNGHAVLASCLAQFHPADVFESQQRRTFPGLDVIQYNEYWELRFATPVADTLLAFVQRHVGISPQSA